MTDDESDDRIHNDNRVIILSDPFDLSLPIIPNNNEIQPICCEPVRFYAVGEMHNQHQGNECNHKKDRRRQSKQKIVPYRKSYQNEDLEYLKPFGLQRVGFQEIQIILMRLLFSLLNLEKSP